MSSLGRLASLTMLAETLRLAVPYACAAMGGVMSERAGVANVALEGMLLGSALGATVGTLSSGSAAVGALVGLATGAVIGAAHGTLVTRARVDAIVSGIALNLLVAAGTRFVLRALYDSSSNSPHLVVSQLGAEGTGGLAALSRVVLDPVTLLAVVAAGVTSFTLSETRFGLHLRACGENPRAAAAAGIDVGRVRALAVVASGALAAIGGVHLAFDQRGFESGMSGGRGFIALACVILAGWRLGGAMVACLVFAALDAAQIVLQDEASVPHELVQMLPYAATLFALASLGGRMRVPAGMGEDA